MDIQENEYQRLLYEYVDLWETDIYPKLSFMQFIMQW